MQCSAAKQREPAPATMARRGPSYVPNPRIDSRSATFAPLTRCLPPPPPCPGPHPYVANYSTMLRNTCKKHRDRENLTRNQVTSVGREMNVKNLGASCRGVVTNSTSR